MKWIFLCMPLFANQILYIKGMSCSMCVDTITSSLKKNHLNPLKVEVGSVVLKEEKDINCKVTRAIENSTEYKVFLDKAYQQPACPKS